MVGVQVFPEPWSMQNSRGWCCTPKVQQPGICGSGFSGIFCLDNKDYSLLLAAPQDFIRFHVNAANSVVTGIIPALEMLPILRPCHSGISLSR